MKRLGDLDLPDSMEWKNRYDWAPVAQETGRTLGGNLLVWHAQLTGGRPIDLAAEGEVSWLSIEQVSTLYAMSTQPGGVFHLVWEGETFQVMFRHQDPPALSVTPILPHSGLFNGTLKLMQV
ncbi:MAG: hypothetical protein HQL89_08995 [Magnetococcales bacterium]|nr:hypothetical protein [Magnetococcales bacterium]